MDGVLILAVPDDRHLANQKPPEGNPGRRMKHHHAGAPLNDVVGVGNGVGLKRSGVLASPLHHPTGHHDVGVDVERRLAVIRQRSEHVDLVDHALVPTGLLERSTRALLWHLGHDDFVEVPGSRCDVLVEHGLVAGRVERHESHQDTLAFVTYSIS